MVAVQGNEARFRFFRPSASAVHLAGDFNGWRTDQLPMHRAPDGYWEARLRLPQGLYAFGYFADGQWYVDFASFGVEVGPLGLRSVLRIAPTPRRAG
jgi:1,4-alpha-glucan branching enzyme